MTISSSIKQEFGKDVTIDFYKKPPTKNHYKYMKQDDMYSLPINAMYGEGLAMFGGSPYGTLEERAQKAVSSFLKGKYEVVMPPRVEKLAHYKPANFSRPKLVPPFMPTHDELSELVAEFAQKEVDSNSDKYQEEIGSLRRTNDFNYDRYKASLHDSRHQLEEMTRQRDEALKELKRLRDRDASIVRIMDSNGRRFRQ